MINAELGHVKSLKEFYSEIVKQQTEAHGAHYCDHHAVIQKYMEDCDSYMELGTHQGATAAAAMLTNPSKISLVDKDMSRYEKFLKPIAEKYCKKNNIELSVKQEDSASIKSTNKTDFLLIDSYHHPQHMAKELMVHQINVGKYILAHDTSIINGRPNSSLYETLETFCKTYPFKIIERNMVAEGYTLLERI